MSFNPFVSLDDNLSDAGDLVSVEVFQAIANNCNYLIDSMPIGSIIMVLVGLPNCPTPDPLLWVACNGGTITNQDSPMRNTAAPNYSDAAGRYMKGYTSFGTIGQFGGSNFKNLQHGHGSLTSVFDNGNTADSDNDFVTSVAHQHAINADLGNSVNFEPVHFRVVHYIKVA